MAEVKPVKAWGLRYPNGDMHPDTYPTRKRAEEIFGRSVGLWGGREVVRVVQPKRRAKKEKSR